MLNYEYAVELAERLAVSASPRLLDYGCGAGQIVQQALARGMDAYGVDEFYAGGSYEADATATGMMGSRIFMLRDGIIPFEDNSFDVITANQVFEHIKDFSTPLREIERVLRPTGVFINIFPSADVWREGHVGIPLAHRLRSFPRARHEYARLCRLCGLGSQRGNDAASSHEWTTAALDWVDTWTHYKPLGDILRAFDRHYRVESYNADYMMFRIRKHRTLSKAEFILRSKALNPLLAALCAKLGGHVFVLRKKRGP